jgi:osmotically-inducible protein OsmY
MRTSLRLGLALAAGLTLACGGRPDTEDNVRKALDQASMQKVEVGVDDDANIVHLKGRVNSSAERTRAEEIANAVVGTSGRVLNELTIVGLNDDSAGALDDDISSALDRMIERDPALKERDIDFKVANGMVAVTGSVHDADEKNRVTQIVKAAPGVKDVANGLTIAGDK